jgi:alkaline phosphatase
MSSVNQTGIGVLTDLHYDGSAEAMNRLYEAVSRLKAGGIKTLLVTGDLINASSEQNAQRLLREVAALCDILKGTVHYMPGNHDLDCISKKQFYEALGQERGKARFHFDLGGYTFICIDGNFSPDGTEYDHGNFTWEESFVPEEELDWLRGRLVASMLPAVVVSHQRIDKECIHAVRNHAAVREVITLSEKVRAVFQGHNHEEDLQTMGATS